jgi:PIN domain nuclease of toxin-antitoxin system
LRYLLDTHILIWTLGRLDLIPAGMLERLDDPECSIYFSAINLWEMVIKTALPRRDLQVDPVEARQEALGFGFRELHVTAEHAFTVASLPPLHKDPFDRLLIAQARTEGLDLLTVDNQVQQYFAM